MARIIWISKTPKSSPQAEGSIRAVTSSRSRVRAVGAAASMRSPASRSA
jgi:hypothetical protein